MCKITFILIDVSTAACLALLGRLVDACKGTGYFVDGFSYEAFRKFNTVTLLYFFSNENGKTDNTNEGATELFGRVASEIIPPEKWM